MLPPGEYRSSVKVEGFAESRVRSIPVVVGETGTIQLRLKMAAVDTSLEVTADTEMADTRSSSLGRALDRKAIQALPLANRTFTQILSLSPGVVVGLPDATVLGRGTRDVEAIGGKTTADNIQFNGVDANNQSRNSAAADGEEVGVAVPAPDTIQEFAVVADTHVVNSNMVNVARAGYMRFDGVSAVSHPILASDLGRQSPTD